MVDRARDIERQMLGAFATVARQWGATPLEGTIAEDVGLAIEDSEIRILYVLGARTEEMRPGDIAVQLGVTRPTLSKSLTRLRTARLVESSVADDDRRSVFVTLTPEGRDAYARLVDFGMDMIRGACAGLSRQELEIIRGFLGRFADRLGGPPPVVFPAVAR
ncbi:MarR family winged helix-turn-helix transcriptional regulator [Leucobacter komagatae]|uniref:HTH marR-type domain-containing protein n=1 Tax=Leucobacter komagatae TaxID=55969 RepID=A0A0D0IV41_9MICO|nr:MarR family transcriptional regulator [Leucobacter komagatae]KIP53473.1 hypothetical protein SD72_01795 [Leucobacter komagatae]